MDVFGGDSTLIVCWLQICDQESSLPLILTTFVDLPELGATKVALKMAMVMELM